MKTDRRRKGKREENGERRQLDKDTQNRESQKHRVRKGLREGKGLIEEQGEGEGLIYRQRRRNEGGAEGHRGRKYYRVGRES